MQHINEVQLQAFIDGELSPDARRAVEEHLVECPECCAKLDDCKCLCANLHALAPQDDLFRPEGEFWACLVGRLKQPCPPTWPWLTSLPPVLLGSIGLVLDVLISATLVFYALTGIGIMHSPGAALASWLPVALDSPALQPLYSALGWSQPAVVERMTAAWNLLGSADQDLLIFASVLILVSVGLGIVLTLFFSWVFFSRGQAAR